MQAVSRLLIDPAQSPARNMAVDEALLRGCAGKGERGVIRFYRWDRPCVSIGYFQSWQEVPEGRPFVRRYTGGGLVEHGEDFTYSLIFSKEHPLFQAGTQESYLQIHQAIANGLRQLKFDAQLVQTPSCENHPACFQKPVRFDLVDSEGNKIAGAAQRRTRKACLHQGSLLWLPFEFDELCGVLAKAFQPVFGEIVPSDGLIEEEANLAEEFERERYTLDSWNKKK